MPLVTFTGIMLAGPVEVPKELMDHLFMTAKQSEERHFSAAFVDHIAERVLGIEWRMPAKLDYLQINIIE